MFRDKQAFIIDGTWDKVAMLQMEARFLAESQILVIPLIIPLFTYPMRLC